MKRNDETDDEKILNRYKLSNSAKRKAKHIFDHTYRMQTLL